MGVTLDGTLELLDASLDWLIELLGVELAFSLLGAFVGIVLTWFCHKKREAARKRREGIENEREQEEAERKRERDARSDVRKSENQIRFIAEASLRREKPINTEAFKIVYAVAERTLARMPKRYRLLAEVSMGSFIKTSSKFAFSSFNSKRVDFLIVDGFGEPALVIEYQGTGHYQGDAKERDTVKGLALKRAGIPLLEVPKNATPQEVENQLRYWLGDDSTVRRLQQARRPSPGRNREP